MLITGESGTGKELVARALHLQSRATQRPFVPVNCAAIPEISSRASCSATLRGAFTDARQSKTGLFDRASDGTLFLDEIGEMPLSLQAKLLRVIEDKRVRPVGATGETPVDVRIVSATNSDSDKRDRRRRFRTDLFYRLATSPSCCPRCASGPRTSRCDQAFPGAGQRRSRQTSAGTRCGHDGILTHYRWPGNIRELQNALQQAVLPRSGGKITRSDLPDCITGKHHSPARLEELASRRMPLQEVEREYARAVLASVNNHRGEAAAILGVDRKTLTRKLEDPD